MVTCTFFGHRDCPASIQSRLRKVLMDLIVNQGVDTFYVGHQGQFDAYVRCVLRELKSEFPCVDYAVVLTCIPNKKAVSDDDDTMVPEGIERVHPCYAIAWRNRWMLRHADYVVAYMTQPFGGAAQFIKRAEKQGKTIVYPANGR